MSAAGKGIEKRVKARAKRKRIQDILLSGLYVTAAVGTALVAPGAAPLLRYVGKRVAPSPALPRRINQAVTRLRKKGLVSRVQTEHGARLRLTEKGRRLAEVLQTRDALFKKPARWDGKWRIVIFDVWEKRRHVRTKLRAMLQKAGFVKIQDSVWVYPYECEELFVFLRTDLRLGRGMLYIVAEEIEHDDWLRHHFGLLDN